MASRVQRHGAPQPVHRLAREARVGGCQRHVQRCPVEKLLELYPVERSVGQETHDQRPEEGVMYQHQSLQMSPAHLASTLPAARCVQQLPNIRETSMFQDDMRFWQK